MHEVVLIESYSVTSFCWAYLLKNNAIPELSVEEIVGKYQGFEGDLIYMSAAGENKSQLEEELVKRMKVSISKDYLLLHVCSEFAAVPFFIKAKPIKCGYDVGVCEQEKTVYSSIFNEVIFGHLSELVTYKNYLNGNLLFPDRSLAEDYVNLHKQLSLQGKGVEDYEEMIIYEIWKENL